jgi:xanthosine utilization system XapX-like protein
MKSPRHWRLIVTRGVFAVLLSVTLSALPLQAEAQTQTQTKKRAVSSPSSLLTNFSCTVPGYGKVALENDPTLNNVALAERLVGTNELVIRVRTNLMKKFSAITRVFWLEHECSHHLLGHTQSTTAITDACAAREEDAADCNAVQIMVNAHPPMIDAKGLSVIENDLRTKIKRNAASGDIYKDGNQRADQIHLCAIDDSAAQNIIWAGECAPNHGP